MNDLILHQIPAGPMANYVYVIGSRRSKECLLVDPAWEIDRLLDGLEREGLTLKGVLATHYHPDHIGGRIFGLDIEGLPTLLNRVAVPIHVHRNEADGVKQVTGLSESDLVRHEGGDVLELGDVRVRLLHTPGHTPGSQCFFLEGGGQGPSVVSGDTLFIGACGRVDLPGGSPEELYESLTQKLAKLPPETVLYPGHNYADRPTSTIGDELRTNRFMRMRNVDDWRGLMGMGG
jgi:glyoxylase-like metal-dependent hydrolase (beta-lactamase superfamily II)